MPDWGLFRLFERELKDIRKTPGEINGYFNSPRAINGFHAPRKSLRMNPISREQVSIFRDIPILATGEMFIKSSRFQRSKKYYCELRNSTIIVYRNLAAAESNCTELHDVITVLTVQHHDFDILQKDEAHARIYITTGDYADDGVTYIRVNNMPEGLDHWRHGLGVAKASPLPELSSLIIESVIGRGGGGKVFVVQWPPQKSLYALKVIDKGQAFKSVKAFRHIMAERRIMQHVEAHPFLLPLQFAFQTSSNLFIGTPFCAGGDLATYIRHHGFTTTPTDPMFPSAARKRAPEGRLSECQTRRIAAELILGLEHLHSRGIVYRDLKLENILIDSDGHIKLGDFGLAKRVGNGEDGTLGRTRSICGTRNYLPPEMLTGQMYGTEADMWSFGVVVYRMLVGEFPFDGIRTRDVFHKIKRGVLRVPGWISSEGRGLLHGLLKKEGARRMTVDDVKRHSFFHGVIWGQVLARKGGVCVRNVKAGCVEEALENNFELSRLQGVTLGEVMGEGRDMEGGNGSVGNVGLNEMVVGFEYAKVAGEVAPLVVRQKSGGLLGKLANIECDGLKSPRKIGSWGSSGSRN